MASTPAEPGRTLAQSERGRGPGQAFGDAGEAGEVDPVPGSTGQILPVLPLGAGLASLGLGLAFLALRLRRS
ncbi:hypothetical protein LHJ74_03760 [Streptomyces sp. N2-109]|uniref:Gram-positive cocci surface proteins LPxTG domain-containing protein n=1 Tax=Streptomyces gossypii TaxID=2883101 RepID=A0ABT2JNW2_9ACTN|nr:hypothetical protein [Streptomyces gossypii]MCT2589060.1 hypothetical protein [Streptomyces gossypii]